MKKLPSLGALTVGAALLAGSIPAYSQDSFFDIFVDAGECRYSAEEIEESFKTTLAAEDIDVSRNVLNSAVRDAMSKIRSTADQKGIITIQGWSSRRELHYTLVYERNNEAHR